MPLIPPPPGLDEFLAGDAAPAPSPAPAPAVEAAPGSAPPPGLDAFIADDVLQAKHGTAGQQAIAALEGGARGLTFGLSDALEAGALGNAPEIQGRRAANPWTANLSQVAGAALPVVATGGAAAPEELAALAAAKGVAPAAETAVAEASRRTLPYLVSRAGQAVEHAAGQGVLGRAAGLGVEGAAYGAGNLVSDAALGDPHLTAQKVISDIGMGAAFGAGLGILSKGVEAALPAATKKLTGALGNLKETIFGTEEAPSLVTRALSLPGGAASGDTPVNWAKSFRAGLEQADKPSAIRGLSKNLQSVYEASKQAANDLYETAAPANIGKALEAMPAEQAKTLGVDVLNRMYGAVEQAGENGEAVSALSSPSSAKIVAERLEKLTGELSAADSAFDVHKALDTFAKQLDRGNLIKFDTLPTAGQMADQEVLKGIRGIVRGNLSDESLWGEAAQHYAQTNSEYSAYRAATRNFQQAFMRKEPSTKQFFVDPGKVATFFNRIGDVSQDVRGGYLNDFLDRASSLSKASENYHGFKAAEDSISGRVTELAKKNQELTELAQALKSRVAGDGLPGAARELGLGYAAHAVGVPNPVIGAVIGGMEAYKAVKNPYQLGATLSKTFDKLKVLGDLAEGVNKRMGSLARAVFIADQSAGVPAASLMLASDGGYDKRVSRIEELAHQPDLLMNHLESTTKELHEAAPNVSEGIHAAMTSAVTFLNAKVPRPQHEMVLSPEWKPSRAQKETFNRYYDAVDDPMTVFKQMKHGTLTNETMEALRVVYPKLLTEMQQHVMETLGTKKAKALGYGTKIALSKFLGQPLDEALLPQVLAANQAILSQSKPAAPAAASGPRTTLGGLKELGVASRTAPRTQEDRDNET